MGKHKHRRRERESGYEQGQMNNGYMGGYNGNMPMDSGNMNQGMNNNQMGMNGNPMGMNNNQMGMNGNPMNMMNGNNPLASILGSMGGNSGGILDLINLLGIGGGTGSGLGDNGGDIMSMISSFMSGGNTKNTSSGTKNNDGKKSNSIEDLLSQITPEDIEQIQNMLGNMNSKKSSNENKKNEESVDEILANLDFNAILNNMNNMDFSNIDFSNLDFNNMDINDIIKDDGFTSGNITTVSDDDIIEENIFREEKVLTQEESSKLINILIKLIDPNKIKLLQKALDQHNDKK